MREDKDEVQMTDAEKALDYMEKNSTRLISRGGIDKKTINTIIANLQRASECEKENKILKNKLTMAEYAEVQEMLRADIKELEDKSQGLVKALELAGRRIHLGAYSMAPLLDRDILEFIERSIDAFNSDETEGVGL